MGMKMEPFDFKYGFNFQSFWNICGLVMVLSVVSITVHSAMYGGRRCQRTFMGDHVNNWVLELPIEAGRTTGCIARRIVRLVPPGDGEDPTQAVRNDRTTEGGNLIGR